MNVCHVSWSSVVSVVTRLRAGKSGICIPTGIGIFFLQNESALGPTQLPIRWLLRYL